MDELEDWLRGSMQKLIQEVPEEEVIEFLVRVKSAHRPDTDSNLDYRNGHGRHKK